MKKLFVSFTIILHLFCELSEKYHSASINHRKLQMLAIEMHKVKDNQASNTMNNIFEPKNKPYISIKYSFLYCRNVKTVCTDLKFHL